MSNVMALPTPASGNVDEVIGDNVHQLMWRAHETQATVAAMLGIGQSSMSLKLRGKRPWFAGEIDMIARHFGISHRALFTPGGANSPTPDYECATSGRPFPAMADVVALDDWRARA